MQPYLFPYIGYFQLINSVDKFVLLDDVNFINKGWINRNKILINGKATWLTFPLENASQNKLIKDIRVVADFKWQSKILKTVEQAYKKAPSFQDVFPIISQIITSEQKLISDIIYSSLLQFSEYLNIDTYLVASSIIYNNRHLKAQDKIIDICQQELAGQFINPAGGKSLYDKEAFKQRQISLKFIKPAISDYRQQTSGFVPGLSMIDVLMFNNKEQVRQMLQHYTLE